MTQLAAILALLLTLAAGQDTGILRVRVTLTDEAGLATPLPRIVILVSDDPPTDEPRRVRTNADGTVELKLAPGNYVVELDEPISFRGKAYTWTQNVVVTAGRDAVLDLIAGNAEAAASARLSADSATLLTAWRDSVVEIWTPTRHASGFVIDAAKGLIATSHHGVGDAAAVEVQLTSAKERLKVPGRVIASERETGAAVVWVNPEVLAKTRPVDLGCARQSAVEVSYKDVITTITASMFANKEAADGLVTRKTSQAIFSDMRIGDDSAGGPVFAENGVFLGISAIDEDRENPRRWNDAWVVPVAHACTTVATALKKTSEAPPAATRLPLEPLLAAVQAVTAPPKARAAGSALQPVRQPATVSSSKFDITLLTSEQANNDTPGALGSRSDFGNWSQYVRDVDPVILVRISPQYEESVLKMLARGAAATQGVMLPPLKSLSANFAQLRAYCGDTEVLPIHPFIVERQVSGRSAPIREGLYVFERTAFGPHCSAIRFAMFSEKDPQRADTKVIDLKLFEQLIKP